MIAISQARAKYLLSIHGWFGSLLELLLYVVVLTGRDPKRHGLAGGVTTAGHSEEKRSDGESLARGDKRLSKGSKWPRCQYKLGY